MKVQSQITIYVFQNELLLKIIHVGCGIIFTSGIVLTILTCVNVIIIFDLFELIGRSKI